MQKTVLISGGLGDIGKAIAVAFGNKGYQVAVSDIANETEAQPILQQMIEQGCNKLKYTKVDVTQETDVNAWIDAVEKEWSAPQVIIPNAGIVVAGAFTDDALKTDDVKRQIDVNFWGSYYMAVHGARKLKEKSLPGSIVFIGSWAAERPATRIGSYCVSKAAVRMLSKTMALELAESKILVNEIALGIVEGGLSKKNQQKDPELLKTHLNAIPVHQLIQVDEVAKHVLMMSDFENMNITGSCILVDGGLSLTSKMTP